MLNDKLISIHVHLMYKEPAKYILDLLSEVWNKHIYLSLIDGNKHNSEILKHAQTKFADIRVKYIKNKGNDQYGFYHTFKLNEEETPWILYLHDKHLSKIDWLDEIMLPILHYQDVNPMLEDENVGIICSGSEKYVHKVNTEEQLTDLSKNMAFHFKHFVVKARHTLTWFRELQYILVKKTGFIDMENINPLFAAGTIFIARRKVVELLMSCIHEDFFEDGYRTDGEVEHAMERFYYYVAHCLKYKINFLKENNA